MSKQIFIISGAIFAVLLLVLGGFWLFKGNNDQQPATSQTENQPTDSAQPAQPTTETKITKIVEGPVLGAALNSDGSKIMYFQEKNFLSTDFEGALRNSVGAYPFDNVLAIEWNSPKNQAVVKTKDGYYSYSLDSDQAQKLKDGTDIATWSSRGDKLIYKFYNKNNGQRSLNVAEMDGSGWLELKNIPYKKLDFQINPQTGEIGYYPLADSFSGSEFNSLSFDGKQQRVLYKGKYGASYLWSPDGKKLLISFVTEAGGKRTEIAVVNQNGGEYRGLDFPTVTGKCAWSKDSIHVYCSMMSGFPDDVVLPNDWNSGKYNSTDTFWKINTENGKKDRIVELSQITDVLDATNLFLDQDEKSLFFTDKKTQSLYRIEL